MNTDYDTLTKEELEELAEFVDWSLVPPHLLTDEVKKSFGALKGLKARIWFEDLLSQMMIKEDRVMYPDFKYFFIDNNLYMELNKKDGKLWCSYYDIWLIFSKKYEFNYNKTQLFIKNIIEQYLKNIQVIPIGGSLEGATVEQHFKNIGITPITFLGNNQAEQHFENLEITPIQYMSNGSIKVERHFKNL